MGNRKTTVKPRPQAKPRAARVKAAPPAEEKIRIGWFSFSCCEDNTIVMTEVMNDHWQEWKRRFDFRHARVLKSHNIFDQFDIAFIEGAIASDEQAQKVRDIRARSTYLVAVGACACIGLPAGQRNAFTQAQQAQVQPFLERFNASPKVRKIAEVVKVDVEVPGCPMDPDNFLRQVNALVARLRATR